MAEPASWQLVEYLRTLLQQVTVANGYQTDLGAGAIVLDDADVPDDDTAPAIVIEATLVTPSTAGKQQVNSDIDITIEFGIPRTGAIPNPKQLVHRARHDIVRALMVDPKQLPRFIRTLEVGTAQLFSADDNAGSAFVIAQVTARAGLTELKLPAT